MVRESQIDSPGSGGEEGSVVDFPRVNISSESCLGILLPALINGIYIRYDTYRDNAHCCLLETKRCFQLYDSRCLVAMPPQGQLGLR